MPKKLSLEGTTYDNVLLISKIGKLSGSKYDIYIWNCRCLLCGKEFIARQNYIRAGRVKDCGCSKLPKPIRQSPYSSELINECRSRAESLIDIGLPGYVPAAPAAP